MNIIENTIWNLQLSSCAPRIPMFLGDKYDFHCKTMLWVLNPVKYQVYMGIHIYIYIYIYICIYIYIYMDISDN